MTPTSESHRDNWHPARRIAFRFAFCYLGLYSLIAFGNVEEHLPYERLWQTAVPWVGQHVFHLEKPITYFPSGSGDKTSDWVLLFCHLVLSVVATLVWTLLDRKRPSYRRLDEFFRVMLRYAVALTMLAYGSVKVVQLQFPAPGLSRLLEPLGDFSPMGLLWTFMGASGPYNFFAGFSECLGGLLLLFRRTTTLGALVTAAVMTNVAMLNFAYDVPVKLLSSHLVLMCLYLALPDAKALFDFLVANRPAKPAPAQPHFHDRRWSLGAGGLKFLLIGYVAVTTVTGVIDGEKQYGSKAPKSPLFGIWEVEEFSSHGQPSPPLLTEKTRWRYFISQAPQFLAIRTMDNQVLRFEVKVDEMKSTIAGGQGKTAVSLNWARPDADHLTVAGIVAGQPVSARMKRLDETKFTLLGRGFHWVSEYPFNR